MRGSLAHIQHPRSPELSLGLSSDHLIVLVQYNIWRACLFNILMAGLEPPSHADCELVLSKAPTKPIPPSLLSTSLQQHVLHPSWIDIFPEPKRRDNMILSGDAVCGIDGGSVHWHVYISGEYREGPHLMVQGMKKKGERV